VMRFRPGGRGGERTLGYFMVRVADYYFGV